MNKLLGKVLRGFGVFVFAIVIIGIFTLIIYNNTLYPVQISSYEEIKEIEHIYELNGTVTPKYFVEVYAQNDLTLENINIQNTQIVEEDNLFLIKSVDGTILDLNSLRLESPNSAYDLENLAVNDEKAIQTNKKIYIDYINENISIKKGDLILKYCYYDENLVVKSTINRDLYDYISQENPEIKFEGNKTLVLKIVDYEEFPNSFNVSLEVENALINVLVPFENVNMITTKKTECDLAVKKTLFLPNGQIALQSSGAIYYVIEEDTILGKQYVLVYQNGKIMGYNDTEVGLEFEMLKAYSCNIKGIVAYPTSNLKDGMRVRIK